VGPDGTGATSNTSRRQIRCTGWALTVSPRLTAIPKCGDEETERGHPHPASALRAIRALPPEREFVTRLATT
jgi:hypothetical protein